MHAAATYHAPQILAALLNTAHREPNVFAVPLVFCQSVRPTHRRLPNRAYDTTTVLDFCLICCAYLYGALPRPTTAPRQRLMSLITSHPSIPYFSVFGNHFIHFATRVRSHARPSSSQTFNWSVSLPQLGSTFFVFEATVGLPQGLPQRQPLGPASPSLQR